MTYQAGFADRLKTVAALALGFEGSTPELVRLMDDLKEDGFIQVWCCGDTLTHLSGREYLQNFGNHARLQFGLEFWVNQVLPQPSLHPVRDVRRADSDRMLESMYPYVDTIVITDVRYPNEAKRIRDLGGHVWEVIRPGIGSDGHASEQPLPPELVDLQINNSGDLDDLRDEVRAALRASGIA